MWDWYCVSHFVWLLVCISPDIMTIVVLLEHIVASRNLGRNLSCRCVPREAELEAVCGANASMARSCPLDWIFIFISCSIAVGTNLSQFICIGRFTAVSFQVLGHMKTILVLILGFFFFGKEGLNLQVVLGMIIAVAGMIWYGNASSKPGGKERWSYSLPTVKTDTR